MKFDWLKYKFNDFNSVLVSNINFHWLRDLSPELFTLWVRVVTPHIIFKIYEYV